VFGEKDFQQLELIRRMNDDLGFGIDVISVDTVRDADGLALSSRNSYLTDEQREDARAIPQALAAGRAAASAGPDAVVTAAQRVLDDAGITIDYLDVRGTDCESLTSPGAARLFVACLVGTTRLIDNCAVELGSV
jgi:pantoate--beta-alanine ligase